MTHKTHPARRLFALSTALLLFAGIAGATARGDAFHRRVRKLMAEVQPAFVFIGGGSGAVISSDGYLITNAHVVRAKTHFTVRLGSGHSHPAEVVGLNKEGDLALLRIRGATDLKHLPLGDSDAVSVGSYSIAVGNPLALGLVDQQPTFTIGVISAKHLYRGAYNDALVTDAPINPGNSGGPLVNLDGELIGVNGQIETRWGLRANTGIGLAIPVNQIKRWLPHLKKAGGENVPRGRLMGIRWKSTDKDGPAGALIRSVAEGSRAAEVGLEAEDLIVAAEGLPVWNPTRLMGILGGYPAGSRVTLSVRRGEETKNFTVTLQEPPEPGFKLDIGGPENKQVIVKEVTPDSAAHRAGLRKDDIVVAVAGQELTGPPRHKVLYAAMRMRQLVASGQQIALTVERKEKDETVQKEISFFPRGK